MTRKQFLASAAAPALGPPAVGRRPNVLILMSDQHRWDLMTCAGRDLVPTPHLDRIAARGVRFTNACCPYPVCVGSRLSFLSGLYAHRHGGVNNEASLDFRARTIAHHFQDQGYITALIGKMHLNQPFLHGFNFHLSANDWLVSLGPKIQLYANDIASHQHGPQFFRTVLDHGSCFPEFPFMWSKGSPWVGKVTRNPNVASDLGAEDHLDAFVARETIRFLREYKEHPFFLIAGFLKPHPPFHPPREWAEKYPADKMTLPHPGDASGFPKHIQARIRRQLSMSEAERRSARAGYMGNLAFLDSLIGDVSRGLEETGLLDNTIVIYTSDHGDMDGDHGLWQKFVLYEPSVNVPLIVSYPKALPQGRVCRALVEYLGIYPTAAELTGIPAPRGIDGASFAKLCRDPDARGPEARFAEYALDGPVPMYSVRTQRHKYVHHEGDIDELFDLEADPGENTNLVARPGLDRTRRELRDRLFAWYNPEKNPYRRKSAV